MARRKSSATSRRGKPTGRGGKPRRRQSSAQQTPSGWTWAIGGLSVGLLIAAIVWLASVEKPQAARTAGPASQSARAADAPRHRSDAQARKPIEPPKVEHKYDFYEMLPNQSVEVPDEPYRGKDKRQPLLLPETTTRSAKSSGRFILQAGSFRHARDANRRRAQLAMMGVESHIEKVRVNDGAWHRVKIGPFKSLDEANRIRTRLLSEKIQTMLVNVGK